MLDSPPGFEVNLSNSADFRLHMNFLYIVKKREEVPWKINGLKCEWPNHTKNEV